MLYPRCCGCRARFIQSQVHFFGLLAAAFLFAGLTEPQLWSQNLLISEFMAANNSGARDADGEFSDWIEIYNPDRAPVSLGGWHLSDDPLDLTKWQFPDVTIPGQGFMLVFASGKDRTDPQGELHTNFSLDRDGEYLALTRPDGTTKATEFAPTFPRQLGDVSYGVSMSTQTEQFVSPNGAARLFFPANDQLGLDWIQPAFNHSDWTPVTLGVGYDRPQLGQTNATIEPVDVTQPGDSILPTSNNSPGNETSENAIDNTSATKYLNFDKLNAGFTVTPTAGDTVLTRLRFTSANDAPERDPTSFVVAGSRNGIAFTEIARGGIPDFTARFASVEVAFTNTAAYLHYRLLFPTVRNAAAAVAVQISEVEFLGYVGAPPLVFLDLISSNVQGPMFAKRTSAYLRVPFTVQTHPPLDWLALWAHYDDGFVAFLNGVEVARANAPPTLAWNSRALSDRSRTNALREQRFDLSGVASLIVPGPNLLAVQALNDRADSPDFLLRLRLDNAQVTLANTGYMTAPSPGKRNSAADLGLVADPVFDRERGFYSAPIQAAITCATEGATIRCTTNGAAPSLTNGFPYVGPIPIQRTTTLRAAAFRNGWRSSQIVTHTYLFLDDIVNQNQSNTVAAGFPALWDTQPADYGMDSRVIGTNDSFGGKYRKSLRGDLLSLPSMSIVMDVNDMFGSAGIYSYPNNRGDAWERVGSLELIYPNGPNGFQANAGFRIQGGAFRRFDLTLKKSFRVIFREEYGQGRLRFALFGPGAAQEFNNIVLRANSNDAWPYNGGNAVYVRDAFAVESARAMGIVASHGNFVHLYINGRYWGLYNPMERPDAVFSASYHGGNEDHWDAINQDSVPDGNYDAWNRLMATMTPDWSDNAVYQKVQGRNPDGTRNPAYEVLLDVENMIDYMIMNFYIGNSDWPGRNYWVGRDRTGTEGFQFYPWDSETALSGVGADNTAVNSAVARPYAAARANAEFRLHFADRVYRHFFNGGAFYVNPAAPAWNAAAPTNNRPAARFAALAETVRQGIVGESARWGDQLRTAPYTRDEHWQAAVNSMLANYFPARSASVLAIFRNAGLYPRVDAPLFNHPGGSVNPGFQLVMSAPRGTIYYTTNGTDPRTPTALIYSGPIPLLDRTVIKARVLNGGEWSALHEASFIVGTPELVISELHYHPANPSAEESAAGFADENAFEFVELYNPGTATFDLNGVRFVEGIDFDFTSSAITQLAPGAHLLVVQNRAAFEYRYGVGLPIAGEYAGRLSNAGERVALADAADHILFAITYGTAAPWPAQADGSGPSLELRNFSGDRSAPDHWRSSTAAGGSPGLPVTVEAASFSGLVREGNQLRLSIAVEAGRTYHVFAAERLVEDGGWRHERMVGPATSDGAIDIVLEMPTGIPARFFKTIVALP